jgi:hypothetical protein
MIHLFATMHLHFDPAAFVVPSLVWSYLVWTWVRLRRMSKLDEREFVAIIGVAALSSATVSTALGTFLFIRTNPSPDYTFSSHPVELFLVQLGFVTALLGLILGWLAPRKTQFHIILLSVLNLWMLGAVASSSG